MLPATLLPVTEPTILVVPVPARSEASAPACQLSLTSSDISASPEVNLDSMVATQVKHYVHPTEKYPRLSKMPTRASGEYYGHTLGKELPIFYYRYRAGRYDSVFRNVVAKAISFG